LVAEPGDDARSQLVFFQTALAQYGDASLEAVFALEAPRENLRYDWDLGTVRLVPATKAFRTSLGYSGKPLTLLISPSRLIVRRWEGFVAPADLGFALRRSLRPTAASALSARPPPPRPPSAKTTSGGTAPRPIP